MLHDSKVDLESNKLTVLQNVENKIPQDQYARRLIKVKFDLAHCRMLGSFTDCLRPNPSFRAPEAMYNTAHNAKTSVVSADSGENNGDNVPAPLPEVASKHDAKAAAKTSVRAHDDANISVVSTDNSEEDSDDGFLAVIPEVASKHDVKTKTVAPIDDNVSIMQANDIQHQSMSSSICPLIDY